MFMTSMIKHGLKTQAWNPNNTNMGLIVSQSQMHTLHEAGMAREYKVVGNTSVKVTWSGGQTLGNGASWTYV